jgi:hypothetical protein
MQTIQEILSEAGHTCEGDNRNRAIKECNTALKNGVKIWVAKVGRMQTPKREDRKPYTLKVSTEKWQRTSRPNFGPDGQMDAFDVLKTLALFLQNDNVKKEMSSIRSGTPDPCGKCQGKGVIPAFYYYANGVCFECMGLGFTGKFTLQTK